MIFHCFLCNCELISITDVCTHLRRKHALFDGKLLVLRCCVKNCSFEFKSYSVFRKHLQSHLTNREGENDKPSTAIKKNRQESVGDCFEEHNYCTFSSDSTSSSFTFNVFNCFVCNLNINTISEVCAHLKKKHALFDGKLLVLKCCVSSCFCEFKTYATFKNHLEHHAANFDEPRKPITLLSEKTNSSNSVSPSINDNFIVEERDHESQKLVQPSLKLSFDDASEVQVSSCSATSNTVQKNDLSYKKNKFSTAFDKLDSSNIARATTDKVVNMTTSLVTEILDDISNISREENVTNARLQNYITEQRNCIKAVHSRYKRQKIYKAVTTVPQIKLFSIGTRFDQVYDKKSRTYKTTPVSCNVAYIPILETVKFILSNDNIRAEIEKDHTSNPNLFQHFLDGSYYKSHPLFIGNQKSIGLQLYFDEYEPANGMGSKTGGHKLGAIYVTLRNLPFYFNAILENIHLVALFYSADIKDCGINKILSPIVNDIKKLETEGIIINDTLYRGTICAFSYDNLGANMLYSLPQSFRAKNYCRICTVEYDEAKTMTEEREDCLRSYVLNFSRDIDRCVGMKGECVLNELKYFDIFECPSVDFAHDILEGVAQLEVKDFISELVKGRKRLISLGEINDRIKAFNYGRIHNSNKPSPIVISKKSDSIRQRAMQMYHLLRCLPFILSDIIEKLNEDPTSRVSQMWEVILLLCRITDIVYSPVVTESMIAQLKVLIKRHHFLFLQHYRSRLIPKHHMMLHYALIAKLMGPLKFLWTLRFEGKHNYFKDLIEKYKNYKNLIQTLAEQHQHMIHYSWTVCDKSLEQNVKANLTNLVKKTKLIEEFSINNSNIFDSISDDVFVTEKAHYKIDYKVGNYIALKEANQELPTFLRIAKIIVDNKKVFTICEPWETVCYDENYIAYEICEKQSNIYTVVDLSKLTHIIAYDFLQPYHKTTFYIKPSYYIL